MIVVGAVAYHERVVPIWETFKEYFEAQGVPTDYVLYSNYERLVAAVETGQVDIGWNTNTAFVALDHRLKGGTQVLGMRDVDATFASVIVTRRGEEFESVQELAGKRLALGSRDSGHAAILPLYYLSRDGLDPSESNLVRFDTDLGKHGDTGDSEARVIEAVANGDVDAGAVGDATWIKAPLKELSVSWRSPTYYHCNFTALDSFDRWRDVLLSMDYNDPKLRHAMDLEGVKRWLPSDKDGYASLYEAMKEQGYL